MVNKLKLNAVNAKNVSATLYNRLVKAKETLDSTRFSPVVAEIIFKLSGDTTDENVQSVALKTLERKIEVVNAHKRKKQKALFEQELYVVNSIIQSIFPKDYMIDIVDEKIILSKKV